MLDQEQIDNWDFVVETNKDTAVCPKCKTKYEKHHWSPGGTCAPCSNGGS